MPCPYDSAVYNWGVTTANSVFVGGNVTYTWPNMTASNSSGIWANRVYVNVTGGSVTQSGLLAQQPFANQQGVLTANGSLSSHADQQNMIYDGWVRETIEQQQRRMLQMQEAAVQQDAQRREHQKLAEVADSVAEKLLVAHLDPKQREDFQNHRHFEVIQAKTKRVYRIKHGWAGNVEVWEGGRRVESLCIHPAVVVPFADNLLAQKLLLEADEPAFRRIANITKLAA